MQIFDEIGSNLDANQQVLTITSTGPYCDGAKIQLKNISDNKWSVHFQRTKICEGSGTLIYENGDLSGIVNFKGPIRKQDFHFTKSN